jgi:hypothetical protein
MNGSLCYLTAFFLLQLFELYETFLANVLALEVYQIIRVIAEEAGRMILFQNDGLFVDEDFDGVLYVDTQCPAKFDGDYDPPEGVHFANDAR